MPVVWTGLSQPLLFDSGWSSPRRSHIGGSNRTMTNAHTHELRALLLAALVALSVLAGGVAFAGTTAAEEHHGLTAGDGAGGNASTLIAGFDDQLPDGVASDDDTLRVEATNESFPNEFEGELRLPNSDVTFADEQAIEITVYDEMGNEIDAGEITSVSNKSVTFTVNNTEALSADPVAIEIRQLRFDAGDAETGILKWTVNGENATHDLRVEPFEADLTATDENGGFSAAVTAGAENQTMVGANTGFTGGPANNLVLQGDEAEFPSQFVATISLEGKDVDFHERNNGDITATSSSGDAFVPSDGVSATEIRVEVARFDGTDEDATIIELDGVTFDVPPNASDADVTWEVSTKSASYGLLTDRLDANFTEAYAVPRGLDGTPQNGATVEITGQKSYTSGLHDSDENITVEIPADRRD
ncbi:MAG: surface glycoprotein (TIGR04207 family), partial [Natronomonas sp.]